MAEFVFETILSTRDLLENKVIENTNKFIDDVGRIISDNFNEVNDTLPRERNLLQYYQSEKSQLESRLAFVRNKIAELEAARNSIMQSMKDEESKFTAMREIAGINKQIAVLSREKGRLQNNINIYTQVIKLQQEYVTMLQNASRFLETAYSDYKECKRFIDDRNQELLNDLNSVIEIITDYYRVPSVLGVGYNESYYLKIDKDILKDYNKHLIKKSDDIYKIITKLANDVKDIYNNQDNVFDSLNDGAIKNMADATDTVRYLNDAADVMLAMYDYLSQYDSYAKKEVKTIKLSKLKSFNDSQKIEGSGLLAWILIASIIKF